jgi:transcriptional regulator with XRE-family HTH domain
MYPNRHDSKRQRVAFAVSPVTLSAWRESMGYSQRDACKALGCSRSAWTRWEAGGHSVPRYIGLACAALALGMGEGLEKVS